MAEITVINTGDETEGVETPALVEDAEIVGAVETASDNAVKIARIEAEKEITIAAINAETTEAAIQANNDQELAICRNRITELEAQVSDLTAQLIQAQSTPQELPPKNPESESAAPTPEPPVDPTTASEPPPPPRKKVQPHNWI